MKRHRERVVVGEVTDIQRGGGRDRRRVRRDGGEWVEERGTR
jgi:hypothetical protein